MKRVEPQTTTIRGRPNSFFASASFSSGVSSCGYDTGSSWWRGPRGACGDENEGVQELVTLATMQAVLGYTSEAKWLRHTITGLLE
jgi:hypothetical protein